MRQKRFLLPLPAGLALRLIRLSAAALLCFVAFTAISSGVALADEEGCSCHSEESEAWQDSTHHQSFVEGGELTGPTCEDCHGEYVRGHPDNGTMTLPATTELCSSCHSDTYAQWEHSLHAQENVQCTGCHLVHSQTLRLEPEQLCESCHKAADSDTFHLSHRESEIGCIDCHVFPSAVIDLTSIQTNTDAAGVAMGKHDFTVVDSSACVDCHTSAGQDGAPPAGEDPVTAELMTVANRVPGLTAQLEVVQKENNALASLSYGALGLGIGIGAVMGMALVLVAGYVARKEDS
jgi:hypothetical protein